MLFEKPKKKAPAAPQTKNPLAGEKPAPHTVNCVDYRNFLAHPESVQDCQLRIAIIRHAACCAACLDLVFEKLSNLSKQKNVAPDEPDCASKAESVKLSD